MAIMILKAFSFALFIPLLYWFLFPGPGRARAISVSTQQKSCTRNKMKVMPNTHTY